VLDGSSYINGTRSK